MGCAYTFLERYLKAAKGVAQLWLDEVGAKVTQLELLCLVNHVADSLYGIAHGLGKLVEILWQPKIAVTGYLFLTGVLHGIPRYLELLKEGVLFVVAFLRNLVPDQTGETSTYVLLVEHVYGAPDRLGIGVIFSRVHVASDEYGPISEDLWLHIYFCSGASSMDESFELIPKPITHLHMLSGFLTRCEVVGQIRHGIVEQFIV